MGIGREGNVKWVDGLRGVASFSVVLTHLFRAWDAELFNSTSSEDAPPRVFQLPYFRVLVQGRIGVAIFAFVTGYVCALKPIRLYRQGNQEAALVSISRSALRRFPRLFLPAAAATTISWLLDEMGLYTIAKHQDSWWVAVGAPACSSGWVEAVWNLVYNIVTTWTWSRNGYDKNQWTMLPLLRGSIWVYIFMMATAFVQPRYRMMASLGMWVYFYCGSDSTFGMQFFWGTFIADLQSHRATMALISSRPRTANILSGLLIFIGFTFASYPEAHADWMTWSRMLTSFMERILPLNPDYGRFGTGIGLEFISSGILLSPYLQKVLSSPPLLFLGRMSFAVYLLHGPLIRTVLVWLMYGLQTLPDHEDEEGNMVTTLLSSPGVRIMLLWQIVWLPLLYGVAILWTTHVDPWFDRVTNKLVDYVKLGPSDHPTVLPTK